MTSEAQIITFKGGKSIYTACGLQCTSKMVKAVQACANLKPLARRTTNVEWTYSYSSAGRPPKPPKGFGILPSRLVNPIGRGDSYNVTFSNYLKPLSRNHTIGARYWLDAPPF